MTTKLIKTCISFLALAYAGHSPALAADSGMDRILPIPVVSSGSLQENLEVLKGKIEEVDRQRLQESISHIYSFMSRQKVVDASNKEQLATILLANRTPRQVILIGYLLLACQLDLTLSGQVKLDSDEEDNADKFKEAILRDASARRAFCLEVISRYSKQQ